MALSQANSSPVNVSIEESHDRQYYDIAGRTSDDLADVLIPRGWAGTIGETSTSLSIYTQFRVDDTSCQLSDLTLHLAVNTTRPRWIDEERGSRRIRRQWARFLANLQTHEDGHAEIARRGAAIIGEQLSQTPPTPDCQTLSDNLDAMKESLWDRFRISHREYDTATEHGRTQGAYIEFRNRN